MTSRFFQADSSSESDSDEQPLYPEQDDHDTSEEDSSEDEDEDDSDDSDDSSSDDGKTGVNRFLKSGGDSSSDEESDEEKVVVVRSAKDKRIEEAEGVVKLIENAVKINDWHAVSGEFDKLTKMKDGLVKLADGKMPKLYSMFDVPGLELDADIL
jgi:translation initiation factor 3 subunit C